MQDSLAKLAAPECHWGYPLIVRTSLDGDPLMIVDETFLAFGDCHAGCQVAVVLYIHEVVVNANARPWWCHVGDRQGAMTMPRGKVVVLIDGCGADGGWRSLPRL